MRRSTYRRASSSGMPSWLTGRRRIIAAAGVLVAFGGIVTVTQVSNASTTPNNTQNKAFSACDNITAPPKAKLSKDTRKTTYTTNNGTVTQHAEDGAEVPSVSELQARCRQWVTENVANTEAAKGNNGRNNNGQNKNGQNGQNNNNGQNKNGQNGQNGQNKNGQNGQNGQNNNGQNNNGQNNNGQNNNGQNNNNGGAATPPPGAGLDVLARDCSKSQLQPHTGFQDGNRCVSTAFGEVGLAANNPSLLITQAPKAVRVGQVFTLKVSTRNLIRDRFLGAGAGGYYVESSVLKNGLEQGHFHTGCRMLDNTNAAPNPDQVPAFFAATEDNKGGATPDTVTIQVPGLPSAGTAQCLSWAGDGSHRVPMMQRANELVAVDSVRIQVN